VRPFRRVSTGIHRVTIVNVVRCSDADARPAKPVTPRVPPTAGFSEDWFSRHAPVWSELLGHLKGRECQALEVGIFEGRPILPRPRFGGEGRGEGANAPRVDAHDDTCAGGAEHAATDLTDLEARFRANTAAHAAKLVVRKGRSEAMLRELPLGRYDFVSVDGSHEAADVLSDAVLSWPLVKPGGLVCFDDYEWWIDAAPERSPKLAIDSFLATMRGRCSA
jgi:Methyltransferase domain